MLRRLVLSITRIIHNKQDLLVNPLKKNSNYYNFKRTAYLSTTELNEKSNDDYVVPINPSATDTLLTKRSKIIDEICDNFRLPVNIVKNIFDENPKLLKVGGGNFHQIINILLENSINKISIVENPYILSMTPVLLESKLHLLKQLNPKDINDLVPLLYLSGPRLNRICYIAKNEQKLVPQGNRVYLFSEKLNVNPKVVAKYFSRKAFIMEISIHTLLQNLNLMTGYGIASENILRDLWAFRYTPGSVRARLERAKFSKKDKIMPWMVRCPEKVLQKSLNLTLTEKSVLGSNNSVIGYISNRLGFDMQATKVIAARHPAILKVRVTKIKEILDFLLGEGGYDRFDVAQVPRILCHGLETTKERLKELSSYGCKPSSLTVVCKSKREYIKFLSSWNDVRNKTQN